MTRLPSQTAPWLGFCPLLAQHTSPTELTPSPTVPQGHPGASTPPTQPSCSPPTGTFCSLSRSQPSPEPPFTVPAHLHPLPAALSSVPQFTLLQMGANRRARAFWGADGDGEWNSGTPQPPSLHEACGTAVKVSPVSHHPGWCGWAAKIGAQGHVRAGQTEQERVWSCETAPWQEKEAGLPRAGRLGTPHKAASV